jgi:hypothetical protein
MSEPPERILVYEYFYKRLCEVDEEIYNTIAAIRTKKGLIILCDRLRALEVEKQVLMRVYDDLRVFFLFP